MPEQIRGYQRRVNGRLIQVKEHVRENEDATQATLDTPGRPPMAGKPGKYANGRAIPGVWIDPKRIADTAAAKAQELPPLKPAPVEENKPKKGDDVGKAAERTRKAAEVLTKIVDKKKSSGNKD